MSDTGVKRRGWRTVAAAAAATLIAASWAGVAVAALFFELSTKQWVLAVAAAALVTEGALYVGAIFLGLTLFRRLRSRLRLLPRSRE